MRLSTLAWISTLGLAATACGDGTSSGAGSSNTGGAGGAGAATATGGGGAGGAATGASPRYASGTRLKITVQRAGDAEQFVEVFDSQLGIRCTPLPAADGALRCVPSVFDGSVFFRDAQCSDAVMQAAPAGCDLAGVPAFVSSVDFDSSGCDPVVTSRTYEVGALIGTPPAAVYLRDGTNCVEVSTVASDWYELTETEPSTLAALTATSEPRGTDLAANYLRGEDGFLLLDHQATDVHRSLPCIPSPETSPPVCLPLVPIGWAPAFSDSGCTAALPGAVAFRSACEKPKLAIVTNLAQGSCNPEFRVFEVGASTSPPFTLYGEFCVPVSSPEEDAAALLGAEVPLADLPQIQVVELGTGAVRFRTADAAGGPIQLEGSWITDTGATCIPTAFSDGIMRCGPPPAAYVQAGGGFYADPACSLQLATVPPDSCVPPGVSEYAVVRGPDDCAGIEVHLLGAVHSGPIYFLDTVGCVEVPTDPNTAYHLVGAAVPNSDFVEMTLVTL